MDLWRFFAHRHWFTLRIYRREVRICSRCSGYIAGFFILTIFNILFRIPVFHSLKTPSQLLLSLLLITPLTADWLTQSWGLRDSNNGLRFLTGALLGIGVALLSSSGIMPYLKTLFFLLTAAIITLLGSFGKLLTRESRLP